MKASDLFVKQLEEEGVEYIFGLPGEENLDLLDSIRKSKIKLIVTRHEQAAAFMAATYGRLTRKAGVCFSTLGPGATNLITGIAHAQLVGAPLVSISGQKAIQKNWQGKFQMVDIVNMMKPITKRSVTIADPDTIPTVIRNAFKTAQSPRQGVVHIELPEDVASLETAENIRKAVKISTPSPDIDVIKSAAEMIKKASHPLMIISAAANNHSVSKSITDFVEKTGIYVVHTQMGKGVVSADNSRVLHTTGIHKKDYVNCAIEKSDLIITVGYNIVEYPPSVWNKKQDKKIINIDYVPSEEDNYFNPEIEIVGDLSLSFVALGQDISSKRDFPYFSKVRDMLEEKIEEGRSVSFPPKPREIVRTIRGCLDKDDIVALDNGIYKLWFSRFFKTYNPQTFILDNALATMGAGLPSAMAAKMLNPEKKVLAIVGDGGFMMNSQEIETALRYGINLVVLILNDNAYGFIKWKQKDKGMEDYGLDYNNPDFVKYAESYGAYGIRVSEKGKLCEAVKEAFLKDKLTIIDCPIDYSENFEVFSKELEGIVCPR